MDYSELVVHIFTEESRDFYALEDLWADAKIERIKELV
jgi:ribosome-associated protein